VRRLKKEAVAASRLNHPNILTVFEIGEDQGLHFIATEFIEGETLRERIKQHTVEFDDLVEIVVQVVGALAAAHKAGIIHSDLKPENIMVRPDGYVKLLDFGLATFAEPQALIASIATPNDNSTIEFTDRRWLEGTPAYMAPEQIAAREVDCRTDIFSLGIIMYEVAADRKPFVGSSAPEMMASILKDEPGPIRQLAPHIPQEFEQLVRKALAKDPADRYQNVQELLHDLEFFRRQHRRHLFLRDSSSMNQNRDLVELPESFDPAGGALPLSSKFYVARSADNQFRSSLMRRDSIVLIKGSHQVGKTSLLARGLQYAREAGATVVLTDFQKLNASDLESCDSLYRALAEMMADQINLEPVNEIRNPTRGPNSNFDRYLRRVVLPKIRGSLVWGMDEVDPLSTCPFGSEVFGLFRSWHNERSLDPKGPWQRLTLVISYATEAHLFIRDVNQSPFVVGTPVILEDFNLSQVAELNERYGAPLKDQAEVSRFFQLAGGHPYLVSCGLHSMATRHMNVADLAFQSNRNGGPFGTHLRHILGLLLRDGELCVAVKQILQGSPCPTADAFYRLRRAGLIAGDFDQDCRPRCGLYADYLKRHLP
jgi:serine/threonine protein kinase